MKTRSDGRRYIVLAASFLTFFVSPSMNYHTGVLYVAFLDKFGDDVITAAWLGSMYLCMFALAGPVAGVIITLMNCRICTVLGGILTLIGFATSSVVTDIRLLFLTFGLITGLGQALTQSAATVVLGYHFPQQANLVTGIGVAGTGLGMFVHPALTQYFLDVYGLSGTFLLLGGISFNACFSGFLMWPSRFEKERNRRALSGTSLRRVLFDCCGNIEVLRNFSFLWYLLCIIMYSNSVSILYVYIPDFYQKVGASPNAAAFSISISGVGSLVGRILVGFIANHPSVGSFVPFFSTQGLVAVLTIFLPQFVKSQAGMFAFTFLLGLYTGGFWTQLGPLTLEIVGMSRLATAFGFTMCATGVGFLIGPPLAGLILDRTHTYYAMFIFASVGMFASTASSLLSALVLPKNATSEDQSNEAEKNASRGEEDSKDVKSVIKIDDDSANDMRKTCVDSKAELNTISDADLPVEVDCLLSQEKQT